MITHRHSSHFCRYHFVWIPKYRKAIIKGILKSLLEDLITYKVTVMGGKVIELAVMEDHVHLFCELPPSRKLDEFVGKLKSWCTSQLFKSIDGLRSSCKSGSFWARGYFVGTCGVDTSVVQNYIRSQK